MSGYQDWRIPTTGADEFQRMNKRILNLERRPQITTAQDLLGPGAGPRMVQIFDWNSEEATFNGLFFSSPDDGQVNSPDDAMYWMGETFGTEDGYGYHRLTNYRIVPDGGGSWLRYHRRFWTTGGQYQYSAWQAL